MIILFDQNYPKYVLDALQLIHKLDATKYYRIIYWTNEVVIDQSKPVVFLLDRSLKGIDIVTKKHYEDGYKVFAFKLKRKAKMDPFRFALTILNIWPKVLETVKIQEQPFVYTYRYEGKKLKKVI